MGGSTHSVQPRAARGGVGEVKRALDTVLVEGHQKMPGMGGCLDVHSESSRVSDWEEAVVASSPALQA